jgi:predicted GNAT family acetyltransferase
VDEPAAASAEAERADREVSADPPLTELTVADNSEAQRYEARFGSELIGIVGYRLEPGEITLIHTEVDPAFEGQGVASRLVAGALDDIRRRDLSLVPVCPFVQSFLRRHLEYADLVATR